MPVRRLVTPQLVAVLRVLDQHPDGISGYQIRKSASLHGPTVYNILTRLVADKWVRTQAVPSEHRGAPDRKLNSLTTLGRANTAGILRGWHADDPIMVLTPAVAAVSTTTPRRSHHAA